MIRNNLGFRRPENLLLLVQNIYALVFTNSLFQ